MFLLTSQQDLDASLQRLVLLDPTLAGHLERCQPIALRRQPGGLAGLVRIVLGQQVSVASARAIWQAFEARFPGCRAEDLAVASDEDFKEAKLSRPKIRTVRALAEAVVNDFDPDGLALLDAGEAHRRLVALHGIGPWTADVYLLFCLGVADVFPAGDLALQVAVGEALGLTMRPDARQMTALAQDKWAPERGAAAHLFWAIYRDMKSGRDGIL